MDDLKEYEIAYRDQLADTLLTALKMKFSYLQNVSIVFNGERNGKINFDVDEEKYSNDEVEKEVTEFVNEFRKEENIV